ncbi:MAG: hypothetical protein U1E78_05250 [Gammaproteobacteria bacterium]
MAMNGVGDDLDLGLDDDFDDILLLDEEREEHLKTKEKLQATEEKLQQVSSELQNVKQTYEEEKKLWNADLDDLGDLENFELDQDLKALFKEQEAHIETMTMLTKAKAQIDVLNALCKVNEQRFLRETQEIESLKANLATETQKAQSVEATLQARDQALSAAKQEIESLKANLATETQKAQSVEATLQARDQALSAAKQEIESLKANLATETQKAQSVEATLQARNKALSTANQRIGELEAQLEASKNSGFVYNVKKALNFVNRPSVVTGLAVGAALVLTGAAANPFAIAGYAIASLIGIEGFKKVRDSLAVRHLQAAKKANQLDSDHSYFVHGQEAEQEWKAYLNPLWVATFIPSFMNDKSKAFQMGREFKRTENMDDAKAKRSYTLHS